MHVTIGLYRSKSKASDRRWRLILRQSTKNWGHRKIIDTVLASSVAAAGVSSIYDPNCPQHFEIAKKILNELIVDRMGSNEMSVEEMKEIVERCKTLALLRPPEPIRGSDVFDELAKITDNAWNAILSKKVI